MTKRIFAAVFALTMLAGATTAQRRTAQDARQNQLREQFRKEAAPYRESVLYLMQVHDTKLIVNGSQAYRPPAREDDWRKTMQDLAALDNLCQTKYAGMTNDPNNSFKEDLDQLPATWCEIAARRLDYEKKGRVLAARDQFGPALRSINAELQEVIDNPEVFISEDIQLLMYERAAWRTKQAAKFQKNFAALGLAMPDDFFADVEAKADQLKAKNESLAPGRAFLMPKQKDPAAEAFIRGRYATQKKGVQILKLGMDDAIWQIHRNSLGAPTSQTKVGRALVKVPNRPFCQEHSFAVEKKYAGGGRYGAMSVEGNVGSEGLFMNCN
jgi:hypothetical protein